MSVNYMHTQARFFTLQTWSRDLSCGFSTNSERPIPHQSRTASCSCSSGAPLTTASSNFDRRSQNIFPTALPNAGVYASDPFKALLP